ncbi:MAG TPA: PadR family transcriptional regulator [Candidatus Dormibacteraeota bacterium]
MSAQLNNTSYVLLGFIGIGPRSGYDIKRVADHSTRFFWQISYGQIYPELKRLTELGLVELEADPRGGRARNLYSLTERGRQTLQEWLAHAPAGTFEMRDELLLKLFFAGLAPRDVQLEILSQLRLREEAMLAELRAIEPHAREMAKQKAALGTYVLEGGLRIHQAYLDHIKELERRLIS